MEPNAYPTARGYYALWYCPSVNRFIDENGTILHDMSDLCDVWQLDEWKRTQNYDFIIDRNGNLCELYYPSKCEERDLLRYL